MRIFPLFCANLSRIYNKKFSKYRIYCFAKKFALFGKIVAFCSSQNSASFLLPFKNSFSQKNVKFCKKNLEFLFCENVYNFSQNLCIFCFHKIPRRSSFYKIYFPEKNCYFFVSKISDYRLEKNAV